MDLFAAIESDDPEQPEAVAWIESFMTETELAEYHEQHPYFD